MKQGGRDLDRLAGVEIAIRPYRPMHRLEAAASAIFSPRFRLSRIVSSTPATALVASVFLVRSPEASHQPNLAGSWSHALAAGIAMI